MEKKDIIDYVMDRPENTNPAILGQMIDEVGGSEEEGEVWATYTLNENEYSLSMHSNNEQIECDEGTVTTKTYTEWNNCIHQKDGKYKIKVKGYFLDFPDVEVDMVYHGSELSWNIGYEDRYNDDYIANARGEIEKNAETWEEIVVSLYYGQYGSYEYIYPTKIELIVYKK